LPAGRRANTVTLEPTVTARVRVLLTPQPGRAVGLTELEVWSEQAPAAATSPSSNLAFNAGEAVYPRVAVSHQPRSARQLNDGVVLFPRNGRNRWTAAQSPNREDWVELDFGTARRLGTIELYLLEDGAVKAPASYRIEWWNGSAWAPVRERARQPAQPLAPALNTVRIEPVETQRLRVLCTHAANAFTGLTEIMVR